MIFRACLCVGVIASVGLPSATLCAREYRGMKKQNVDLKSATTLVFGPDDILFIGDSKAAKFLALIENKVSKLGVVGARLRPKLKSNDSPDKISR